ncbi:oxygen-independent coproporphyrinogen III oxidase, partial [Streptococcus pneumoniae]
NNERPLLESTRPTKNEQMEEEMFLGLRMNQGVNKARFKEKFDLSIDEVYGTTIEDLLKRELIVDNQGFISMTERGKVIGNLVFESFLLNV